MTSDTQRHSFVVNDVLVDPIRCEIKRKGEASEEVPLRALQILQCLIENEGELVTYQELEDKVWKGPTSESALYQQVAHLRKALGDDPNHPTFIRTVQKLGYQFIGSVSQPEKSSFVGNGFGSSRKLVHIIVTLTLAMAGLLYWYFSSHADERLYVSLANNLTYPETFVFINSKDEANNSDYPGLLSSLELILDYHLDHDPKRHTARLPMFADKASYDGVMQHYSELGKPTFTFIPKIQKKADAIEITLSINDAITQKAVSRLTTSVALDRIPSALPQFERELVRQLTALKLTAPEQKATLLYDRESNLALINAAEILTQTDPDLIDLQQAITDTQVAIDNNAQNPIAYSMLFELTIQLTSSLSGTYDVDSLMDMSRLRTEQALLSDPKYYRHHYARAEFECWIQNFEQCAKHMQRAIKFKPYHSRLLRLLAWNLIRHQRSPLKVYKLSYEITPFGNDVLQNYRNILIDNNKNAELANALTSHASWVTKPRHWIVDSQVETRYSELEKFANWYYQLHGQAESKNADGYTPPSRYIGYMLLNANQPDLARHWLQNGREKQLPYFELRIIDLLSDMWQGNWRLEKWRVAGVFAEDRRQFQTSHDKINIAYFHYYTGLYNYAEQYLLEVFPYLAKDNFKIDQDNFRYAVYYAEVIKHKQKYKQAIIVNQAIKEYLRQTETSQSNSFDMAKAEFYALNGSREKALDILETTVKEQGWLPNAFLLWPPLEHNPSFVNLRNYPEFKSLNNYVNEKLARLCFEQDCEQ